MALKFVASAVATLALVACTQPTGTGALPCNSGVCKLDVTVSGSCANPANITVIPDPLPVPKGSPHSIQWTIQTDGYTWVPAPPPPPGGISGLPDPPFDRPHVTGNGRKYDIHDANPETAPKDYKYGINLIDPSGKPCAVKDPTIRNGS